MNPDTLTRAVATKVEALQMQLLAKVDANLSGDILQARSGALRASIAGSVDTTDEAAKVASTGVPYAAILEQGGRTPPHEIAPVKAQALRLANGAFARRVRHPGLQIPAYRYMGAALEALRADIRDGLKDAVRTALGTT